MPMASSNRPVNGGDGIKSFDPRILDRSVIAIPLLEEIRKDEQEVHAVIIDLNLDYPDGRDVPFGHLLRRLFGSPNTVRSATSLLVRCRTGKMTNQL
jgi:hypothetical protein